MSYVRKFPKTLLVIFLFFRLASRSYGDDKDFGRTGTPTPDKPAYLSKLTPGPYRVLRPTSVYSEPREDSRQIATIEPGTKVQVVDDQRDWLEIRSKHGRPPGFIKKDSVVPKRKTPELVLHGQVDRPKKWLPEDELEVWSQKSELARPKTVHASSKTRR